MSFVRRADAALRTERHGAETAAPRGLAASLQNATRRRAKTLYTQSRHGVWYNLAAPAQGFGQEALDTAGRDKLPAQGGSVAELTIRIQSPSHLLIVADFPACRHRSRTERWSWTAGESRHGHGSATPSEYAAPQPRREFGGSAAPGRSSQVPDW